ncbi:MAG: trypsin [Saprospiraceae bacterium]|jgi:trypsin
MVIFRMLRFFKPKLYLMKSLVSYLTVITFLFSIQVSNAQQIIGGEPIDISDAPWNVSFEKTVDGSVGHYCGGVIINEYWIVTSAHCISRDPRSEYFYCSHIHAGATDQTNDNDGQRVKVDYVITHPDWESSSGSGFDMAMVKLKEPLVFSDNVQPISYDISPEEIAVGEMTFVSVWGETAPQSGNSDILWV